MKEIDYLYTLIKSLSITEKAYFKKYASRHVLGSQNKYVLLFNEIAASRNGYDETALKKKFRNEKFIKNFPVIKRYLHEMILKSLNNFYSGSSIENEIKNNLRSIEVLYHKALFKNCAKLINSSLKLAYRTDNFILILDLLRWKKNIIHEGIYNGFQTLEAAHNQEKEIMYRLRNLSDYRLLAYRAQSLAKENKTNIQGEKLRKELLHLLNKPLLKSEKKALSYPAAITYHHTRALLYDSLGKNSDAFECRKQLIKVMESHPEKLKLKISNYVIAVYNILGTSLNLKAYNELAYYISKLRSIEKKFWTKIGENDRLLIIMGSSIFELRMHIGRGEFSESFKTLAEIEEELQRYNKKIINDDKLHIFYLLAYGYFGAGKMDTAVKWINKILNDKNINNESKLYVKSKLINLIIHFELGNAELLDYLIKSTYRSLKKNRFSGNDETLVLKFLRQLPKISSQNQITELFAESLNNLKKIPHMNNAEFEHEREFEIQNTFTSSAEFDLTSWLESKISGKSFEEIVKAKR